MRKLKKISLHESVRTLTAQQMQSLKGGSNDYVPCVCSCNNAIGTWTTTCYIDNLGKNFYEYTYCGGNHYARCGTL